MPGFGPCAFVFGTMSSTLGAAAEAAVRAAFARQHGDVKLHGAVVAKITAYHAGGGEALTELPLDVPRDATAARTHERRWRAKLTAAGVTDEGDVEDFIVWLEDWDSRTCPWSLAPRTAGCTR